MDERAKVLLVLLGCAICLATFFQLIYLLLFLSFVSQDLPLLQVYSLLSFPFNTLKKRCSVCCCCSWRKKEAKEAKSKLNECVCVFGAQPAAAAPNKRLCVSGGNGRHRGYHCCVIVVWSCKLQLQLQCSVANCKKMKMKMQHQKQPGWKKASTTCQHNWSTESKAIQLTFVQQIRSISSPSPSLFDSSHSRSFSSEPELAAKLNRLPKVLSERLVSAELNWTGL